MAATYRLLVDWRDNGFFDGADDVTARTLDQSTPLAIRYGRDQIRQLSPTAPGELNFELDNISKDYSPENAASPLAGFVTAGRHVQLQATVDVTTTILYDGYLDDFDIRPEYNDQSVPATCIDALGRLRGVSVTTDLYRGIRTGTAIGYILDAVGWPADARDLDVGASYLPYWWLDDADAFDSLMQLADTEGPAALVTVDSQGHLVFRDRHARLTRPESLTVQATWRSSGAEPLISSPVTYDHGWKEIVNSVSVEVPLRQVDPELTVVWSTQGLITIPAGTPLQIIARSSGAFIGGLTPEQDVDYALLSGSVSIAMSRTSGQSTTITLTSAGGAVIQDLAVRGYAIQSTSIVVTVEDQPSIDRYGRKSYQSGRMPVWANQYDAEAIADLIVSKRSERLPTISVTMRGAGGPVRLAECLTRNLGDRIHLTESLTGLDADCFIEQIGHTIGQGGLEHVTTFGVEKIPPLVSNPIIFGLAGAGFNDGVFGAGAQDDPAFMFRFDTPGLGFNDGRFVN